ncbi:pilin accessory protein (PilO) [Paraburkholderia sp. BL8N3]|nr:type 4b pilus protein PilO2 [Paraburkholderia sp. BL8N3]TCK31766.1 pilin accessory protein (PilO) [Paraburkholderia sp. BL8N3]
MFKAPRRRSKAQARADAPVRQDLQHVEINGHGFVSNLFWQPLNNARSYMAEAKSFGKQNGWDIVAIRRGTRIQAGFVDSGSRNLKGMFSLAASLASVLGDSWLGAFRLKDGRYVVVAVHEMLICPGVDRLCATAEEAKQMLTNAHNTYSFEADSIFAPPELEFASQDRDIYQLLSAKSVKKENRLKQLTFGMSTRQLVMASVGVLAVVGAIGGYLVWHAQEQEAQQRKAAIQRAAEKKRLDELNATARRQLVQAALAHPWAVQANALDFISACSKITNALPLSVKGWTFGSAECSSSGIVVRFARNGGTVEEIREAAPVAFGVPAAFNGGDEATITLALAAPAGGDDVIATPDDDMSVFMTHFQQIDVAPTLEERPVKIEPPKVPDGQPPLEAPVATWRQYHFSFDGPWAPVSHFVSGKGATVSLAGIPGLRIEAITTKLNAEDATLTWHVEGNIYAKK